MSTSSERQRLEAEYARLNYLWEEEVFSAHPDWEELEQWDLELPGGQARAGPAGSGGRAGAGGKGSESASRLTRTESRECGTAASCDIECGKQPGRSGALIGV